jgi:hypothetical protein
MFLHLTDFDGDGLSDILVPTYDKQLLLNRRLSGHPPAWESRELPYPDQIGKGKGVRAADIDLDGRLDLVVSTENYEATSGLVWMSAASASENGRWP